MPITAKEILDFLNEVETRCTYGTFGELTETHLHNRWRKSISEKKDQRHHG